MTADLLIQRARLRGQGDGLFDITVKRSRIASILPAMAGPAAAGTVIDAAGGLVTESFVNPHLHLCKVYTLARMDEAALRDYHGQQMGKAMTAIELAAVVKEQYAEDWILENVRRALGQAAGYTS